MSGEMNSELKVALTKKIITVQKEKNRSIS